jgi:hypothetical protein
MPTRYPPWTCTSTGGQSLSVIRTLARRAPDRRLLMVECGLVDDVRRVHNVLYAGTEAAAGDAARIARDVLARHGVAVESAVHRWHPIEERWETPDVPMPQTEAEHQEEEHQRLVDAEALTAGPATTR